jgi:hypothetical protein
MEQGLGYDSLGEALLHNPSGGAICYIGSPRVDCVAIYNFYKYFFSEGGGRCGPSLYMAKEAMAKSIDTKNYQMRKLCLVTCLLGDPELQIEVDETPWGVPEHTTIDNTSSICIGRGLSETCYQGRKILHKYCGDEEEIAMAYLRTGEIGERFIKGLEMDLQTIRSVEECATIEDYIAFLNFYNP